MATGTGRTGVAVIAMDPLILQVNHEGAIDEMGHYTPIARLHWQMDGNPVSKANSENQFKMIHDLKHSTIRIEADKLTITLFAHMEKDLISIEWCDNRTCLQKSTLSIELPYISKHKVQDDTAAWWYENGSNTSWHKINIASGMTDDKDFDDPLKGRCFGLAVHVEGVTPANNNWGLAASQLHRITICADAGKKKFPSVLFKSIMDKPDCEELRNSHEKWFDNFWNHVWFNCEDSSMSQFVLAYDLYRYFTAVASCKNSEFPLRFQMPILSGTMIKSDWATMQIHSIQTIQAYYGIFRNGDWDAFEPFSRDYRNKMEFYRQYTHNFQGGNGLFIPYETNMWGSSHYYKAENGTSIYADDYHLYALFDHKWSMYSYEHGLAIICFLWDAARAKGNEKEFTEWGVQALIWYLTFFTERYQKQDGKIVFDPATSGESWFNCKNPASWIALFKVRLPQIMNLAKRIGNDTLYDIANLILVALPQIPVGNWVITSEGLPKYIFDNPDEFVMLPAEEFDRHTFINTENPELYSVWPYGLMGVDLPDYDLALRTYRQRKWQKLNLGWDLDAIWAARLGLTDEAVDLAKWQITNTIRCPGGFSFEAGPVHPENTYLPLMPSMQGMGNTVCALYEMICQDRGNELLLLPAWPINIAFSIAIYTASGGRVEITYEPDKHLTCKTEFPIKLRVAIKEIIIVNQTVFPILSKSAV
jgi:alpha-L-fucosidase 2